MSDRHEHAYAAGEWPFSEEPTNEAITTRPVLEGLPILRVAHDDDGWQFLCGTTLEQEDGRVACLACMFEKDRTLGELGDLPFGHSATRAAVGEPWQRAKQRTPIDALREAVEANGWQTVMFPPKRPIWAFTVGLTQSFNQPEVVVFGLPPEVMHEMVELLAQAAASGETFRHGFRTDAVLETFTCELRTVDPAWHAFLLGPVKHFYADEPPTMLQCMWPDKQGKLPHEEGYDVAYKQRQAQLELADADAAGMTPLLHAMRRSS
jgi:hypothetical protein